MNFKNEFDLNIALTSFALINIDEFDKTTNSQQVVLKYLLSSSDVKFRPPYGKTIKQYRRYTSFIGTTNQPLCLLRCQAGHPRRAGQGDEQLPLQLPSPHGERLLGILALREMNAWLLFVPAAIFLSNLLYLCTDCPMLGSEFP